MRLAHLHVANYRGLRDVTIPLSPFICITGENNAGKSSVLQTLSLFLSGSSLKASDYFEPGREITIAIRIEEVQDQDLQLLVEEHRPRIAELIVDQQITFIRRYTPDGKSQLGYRRKVPLEERFHPDNVTALMAGKKGKDLREIAIASFPELDGEIPSGATQAAIKELIQQLGDGLPENAKQEMFVPLPTGMDKSVIPMLPERIYIPAVKDLSDDTKTAETSSFGKILAIVMRTIEPLLADEKDLFDKLSKKLTRVTGAGGNVEDHRLEELKNIEQMIQKYVRESFANISLEIEIPPPELKNVLSTARILADDGVRGPLEMKGDGLRRAVVFSILRAYVECARAAQRSPLATVSRSRSDRYIYSPLENNRSERYEAFH